MNVTYLPFASKRRFGVEIEINRDLSPEYLVQIVNQALGKPKCSAIHWHFTCGNTQAWYVKPDSSCGDLGNKSKDGGGYEVVSAVGKGVRHLKRVESVAQALLVGGAVTNQHCGFHCHVEIKDFTQSQAAILLAYWCKIESIISHMVPSHRLKTHHCKLFTRNKKKFPNVKKAKCWEDFWDVMQLRNLGADAKRTSLTLVNWQRTNSSSDSWHSFDRPTAELRLPEGSVIAHDLKNWTRLFIHFVETASTRFFPGNVNASSFDETLEILGLRHRDSFAILSPGLYETKVWLLQRLYQYARSTSLKLQVRRHWQNMSSADINWRFNFPQVSTTDMPKDSREPRPALLNYTYAEYQ